MPLSTIVAIVLASFTAVLIIIFVILVTKTKKNSSCRVNQYIDTNNTCKDCPSNEFSHGGTVTECKKCSSGFTYNNVINGCIPEPAAPTPQIDCDSFKDKNCPSLKLNNIYIPAAPFAELFTCDNNDKSVLLQLDGECHNIPSIDFLSGEDESLSYRFTLETYEGKGLSPVQYKIKGALYRGDSCDTTQSTNPSAAPSSDPTGQNKSFEEYPAWPEYDDKRDKETCRTFSEVPLKWDKLVIPDKYPLPITNENIEEAVKLYSTHKNQARKVYGPLGCWNISNVTILSNLFEDKIEDKNDLFENAAEDEFIGCWNTENVEYFDNMFLKNKSFNQDISRWNTDKAKYFYDMFNGATSFNADIGNWQTRNVEYAYSMFKDAESFNADIGNWDMSNNLDTNEMFEGATSFNKDLSKWNICKTENCKDMFRDSPINSDFKPNNDECLPQLGCDKECCN